MQPAASRPEKVRSVMGFSRLHHPKLARAAGSSGGALFLTPAEKHPFRLSARTNRGDFTTASPVVADIRPIDA